MSDPLKLELQAVMSHLLWALGSTLRSCAQQYALLLSKLFMFYMRLLSRLSKGN